MEIDKKLYEYIALECEIFRKQTSGYYSVDVGDVIYTYLFSTDEELHVANDWDEGKGSDPYWNDKLNMHCVEVFLMNMRLALKQIIKIK